VARFCEPLKNVMARVKVKTFSVIRDVLGAEVVELEVNGSETVGEIFNVLVHRYGEAFQEKIWDKSTGKMEPFLMKLNDEIISSTFDMNRKITEGDEIAIIFPVGGG
jgi:MoaD family protein